MATTTMVMAMMMAMMAMMMAMMMTMMTMMVMMMVVIMMVVMRMMVVMMMAMVSLGFREKRVVLAVHPKPAAATFGIAPRARFFVWSECRRSWLKVAVGVRTCGVRRAVGAEAVAATWTAARGGRSGGRSVGRCVRRPGVGRSVGGQVVAFSQTKGIIRTCLTQTGANLTLFLASPKLPADRRLSQRADRPAEGPPDRRADAATVGPTKADKPTDRPTVARMLTWPSMGRRLQMLSGAQSLPCGCVVVCLCGLVLVWLCAWWWW